MAELSVDIILRYYDNDPKPFLSLSALSDSMNDEKTSVFTDEEVEKAITGCYSSEITPETPSLKGSRGFLWLFTGGSNEKRERRVGQLLDISKEDLKASCLRYRENFDKDSSVVILCPRAIMDDKIVESTGKIIVLPL
jgi:Zn-dependent M16 (insulinase) family peptidase